MHAEHGSARALRTVAGLRSSGLLLQPGGEQLLITIVIVHAPLPLCSHDPCPHAHHVIHACSHAPCPNAPHAPHVGVMTTNVNSGQQWDAPNCWPPLQVSLAELLELAFM